MAVELPSKAQAEASDQKTDNLPSFKDIGASLNKQFGQTDPKDVGKAIDQNTPGTSILDSCCTALADLQPSHRSLNRSNMHQLDPRRASLHAQWPATARMSQLRHVIMQG